MEEWTIVLLGKTGVGKSATGNTILRTNTFQSRRSVDSVTKQCKVEQAEINGKRIRVVDTPGLFDTNMPKEELAKELARSVYLSREGVHAFILVFPYGRFTELEEEMIKWIQQVFGEVVRNHMILLFTHGDEAEDGGEDLNTCSNEYIRRALGQCGGRCQIFNNKNPNNTQEVTELLEKIYSMVRQNGGRCYTSEVYEEANRSTWGQYWENYKSVFIIAAGYVVIRAAFTGGRNPPSGLARGAVKGLLEGGVAGAGGALVVEILKVLQRKLQLCGI